MPRAKAAPESVGKLTVETVPIDSVSPDPANLRLHPARNVDAIKSSLVCFGQQTPIVVDPDGVIRKGNGTYAAARELGWKEIKVIRTSLTGTQAVAYSIADNRSASLATWDDDALGQTLRALQAEDFDLDAIGFSADEVDALFANSGDSLDGADPDDAPEPRIDQAEELQKKWKTGAGQLWVVPSRTVAGKEHRLLCGDSTRPEDVARLMGDSKSPMMNTDPPYGIDYAALKNGIPGSGFRDIQETRGDIENDDLTDGATLQAFLESMIRAALPHLTPNPAFYLWHPMLTQGTFFAAAAAADILIHRQIIWVKPNMVLTRSGMYHWKHELCFYGWIRGKPCEWLGNKSQVSVWEFGESQQGRLHPTQKPLELFVRPINNHTRPGEVVYEPFCGSGSQVIAAEQTGRLCHAMELAPKFVAVALERLSEMGLEPRLSV